MSDSFGRRLRIERERLEIPLTTIADNTKISITLLEGLERDDLSRWPAGIFRRSFLRLYVEALGLDAEALLREFLTLFPDPQVPVGDIGSIDPSPPAVHTALRLTLDESWSPFVGGLRLVPARRRLVAAALDLAVLMGVAGGVFAAFGRFWLPLGLFSLVYYVGGILILGNTPGVCLFGPVAKRHDLFRPVAKQRDVATLADPSEEQDDLDLEPRKNRWDPQLGELSR